MGLKQRQRAYNAGGRGVQLTLTISPIADDQLDRMVRFGLWGLNKAAVARDLLYGAMRERVEIQSVAARIIRNRKASR